MNLNATKKQEQRYAKIKGGNMNLMKFNLNAFLRPISKRPVKLDLRVTVFVLMMLMTHSSLSAFTLSVKGVDKTGATSPVTQYKWLVEEDATHHVVPDDPATNFGTDFHKSYMPVVAQGAAADPFPALDPAKRYYISVLPDGGYSNGGASFAGDIGDGTVTVYVNRHPIPTAQITIFVFNDNYPLNNAPDLPEEQGLEGFRIILEDAGGKYGMSAGQAMMDAFGNMLGTTYRRDGLGNYILDADGQPIVDNMGDMNIYTDANGLATVRNLAPGKYGVIIVPPNAVEMPSGSGNWVSTDWQQTTTIEGTKVIDAWVKANEPPYFQEFGPAGWHVFVGFVRPTYDATVLTGGSTISGRITNLHLSRPPATEFYSGEPFAHTTPWIGLNDMAVGIGKCVYAQRANDDGTFSIPNVPPGAYQVVVWDDYLDLLIAFYGVTVNPDGSCNNLGGCSLGDVPVFQWFTRLEHWVFNDLNQNGRWDAGEPPIPEQAVNLRWRDGTMYQSFPTDTEGFVPFDQVFPFFSWQVAEVDFARFKATGVTVTVDHGGPINAADPWSFQGVLTPQIQDPADPANEYGTSKYRTETGPVLTEAFQGFLGQTSVMQWGKVAYGPGENGGISGMVYYAVTRAEDDPAYAAAEPWEPGIPRVQVNLYIDADNNGVVDDINGSGIIEYADVDNYPFGNFPGPEDIDHNGNNVFDLGDAVDYTYTDSWDDNLPTGCPGADPTDPADVLPDKCYDGMRNWNQVRPGVFDGGYAFAGYDPVHNPDGLPKGIYIVEAVPPAGYEIIKEEDRNVDFGDQYVPSTQLLPPACVGDPHLVPMEFSLFSLEDENGNPVQPHRAGTNTPLCDRKKVYLSAGQNAVADFFMFTEAPIAGHIVGFILDDTANEFDPASPQFGEKFAPPWMPVSIHDWTGREIGRTYSDQYGRYNALVPSTYTANLPMFSGMSPNMLTTCMNSPGNIDPVTGAFVPDPYFNTQYSTFCYTFQYMPGSTTYLDTPVVPVAAFAGPDQFPLDSEFPDGTPRIDRVTAPDNGVGGGPYVPAPGMQIEIYAMGAVEVPNPEFDGVNSKTITRDYGFGTTPGSVSINGVPLTNVTWSDLLITGTVAGGTTTGQLEITRANGLSGITGITVQVGLPQGASVRTVSAGQSIQTAIDNAGNNDLILVGPGTYDEMVIMWKPVRLQGWGEGATVIRAYKIPQEKTVAWRNKIEMLVASGSITLLPGQEIETGVPHPDKLLQSEEGAGVLVVARANGNARFDQNRNRGARVDGFTITGADTGGGVVVNGYADYLNISNLRIMGNSGFFGGGVRVGHPQLLVEQGNTILHQDADNDYVRIHHNHILNNGGLNGAGGGVSLCTGSDFYEVTDNWISGNFNLSHGGGIGHLGLSESGLIANNTIIFNECFNQAQTVSGGGIFIGGHAPLAGNTLGPGAGSVKVRNNLILGNYAAAGDGAGIRLSRINGQDVTRNETPNRPWNTVEIHNNMIANNVAALAGGGISLQDAVRVRIIHNTVANNDSTATAGEAFTPGQLNQSNPQPAGIVSRAHSGALLAALPGSEPGFSDPMLQDNIIWQNRSFYFEIVSGDPPQYLITDAGYNDLAVLGTPVPQALNPQNCHLTGDGDPGFVLGYQNGGRGQTVLPGEPTTGLEPAIAFDEGGNFIKVRYGPLTLTSDPAPGDGMPGQVSDYHIVGGSPVIDAGLDLTGDYPDLAVDYDGQARPNGAGVDIGADEYYAAP